MGLGGPWLWPLQDVPPAVPLSLQPVLSARGVQESLQDGKEHQPHNPEVSLTAGPAQAGRAVLGHPSQTQEVKHEAGFAEQVTTGSG